MNILSLDTSMGTCSAGVLCVSDGTRRMILRKENMVRGHAEALMPMVAEAMAEAGLGFGELDLIAATLGPGSFTGVRIAIAAARGFALATRAKLWGTDSLTVMARAAFDQGPIKGGNPFAVAVDARGDNLYFAVFDGTGCKLAGPLLTGADEALSLLPDALTNAVGTGAAHLADAAMRRGRCVDTALPDLQPDAAALADLAFEAGEALPTLRPLYLRLPDAKPQVAAPVARR